MIFSFYVFFLSFFIYSFSFILYIHILYPLILLSVAVCKKKISGDRRECEFSLSRPAVTLLVAAYNEESAIEEKIINSLQLDYPDNLLEVVIFSDGSTDRTDAIIQNHYEKNLKFVRIEGRLGKTACQNIAVKEATGEIIIYSDATSIYRNDAVEHIVKCFSDSNVGCVVGKIGTGPVDYTSCVAQEETLYLRFAQWIKNLEGYASMPVGASGAIFAIRRDLVVDLPSYANDDLLRPLSVIQKGYGVVYVTHAVAIEPFQEKYQDIFQKKVRIAKRAVYSLFHAKSLLNPFRYGLFSIQFLTKTLLRRLLLPHFVMLFVSTIFLFLATGYSLFYYLFFVQIVFLGLALAGYFSARRKNQRWVIVHKIPKFCYYYILAISGAMWGILLGLRGHEIQDWKTKR